MTYSLIYVTCWLLWLYGNFKGFEFSMEYEFFNTTNTLIAFGIIGICNRLDKLIEKK
jgi:hypothetical protein